MNILLISGHGQGDCGAVGNGYKEANLVREIVPKLKNKLSTYANVDIFDMNKNMYKFLKSGNTFNFKNYDYVLEIHFNACVNDVKGDGKTTGTEILIHSTELSYNVEKNIVNNISALGFKNRGVKTRTNLQNMNVCKKRYGTSYALLETCFIDDKDDMKLYISKKDDVINAIANGIISGFNLKKVNAVSEVKELSSVNDIVWELSHRGIITDKNLWLHKLQEDRNSYHLARKCINYIIKNTPS